MNLFWIPECVVEKKWIFIMNRNVDIFASTLYRVDQDEKFQLASNILYS